MSFIKKNPVMLIAALAAVISCLFIPPDGNYLEYFDFKTLTCLFCTLAVVCALKNIYFFRIVSAKIITIFTTTRSAIIALVYITFLGSMLIANDMALITFLPLGYYVITSTGNQRYLAFTFIMQNIAANLGGMLTPFGNPQNLFMYSYYEIPTMEFMEIMLLPFLVSVALISICCLFVKNEKLVIKQECDIPLNKKKALLYGGLFLFSIVIVFRMIPYWIGLIVIPLVLFFTDRHALRRVDYPLLLTFGFFFIFSGNVSRIPAVSHFVGGLIEQNTLLFGTLSCQVISNVPSAILLSHFTDNYRELLVAVNIGGAGTLISSLASLITFREYVQCEPNKIGSYLKQFTAYNFGILGILLILMSLVFGA